jgi:hypothetical protein
MIEPVPSQVTKTYPPRGPLQQFRFADSTAFSCFRCGNTKKSKLITIFRGDWAKRLCNGCYGHLLSIYEIKAGTNSDDQKAEQLADALLSAISADEQRQSERLFATSERRAERLSSGALRFIATAEHVAAHLEAEPQLEWSPAIIGLCKAFEVEMIVRIVQPLAAEVSSEDLTSDKSDKDLGRLAAFCAGAGRKPSELGVIAHFLQTVIHSQRRRETSTLIRSFLALTASWAGSHWIFEPNGLPGLLVLLTRNFRNRAAHIDELGRQDYLACRELVIGVDGAIWKLVLATERHKK